MNESSSVLPAVEHRVRVALPPAAAFDLFTAQIARWWPFRGHSCFGDEAVDVQFEPRPGGAVIEVARDGRRIPWGEITEWSPPQGFTMRWYPGLPAGEATLLQVRFIAVAEGGSEVSVHHSGWEARGELAREKRDQYDSGWPATLAAFGACAQSSSARSAT